MNRRMCFATPAGSSQCTECAAPSISWISTPGMEASACRARYAQSKDPRCREALGSDRSQTPWPHRNHPRHAADAPSPRPIARKDRPMTSLPAVSTKAGSSNASALKNQGKNARNQVFDGALLFRIAIVASKSATFRATRIGLIAVSVKVAARSGNTVANSIPINPPMECPTTWTRSIPR